MHQQPGFLNGNKRSAVSKFDRRLFGMRIYLPLRGVVTGVTRISRRSLCADRSPSAQSHLSVGEAAARPALLGGQRRRRSRAPRQAARRTRPPASRHPRRPSRSAGPTPARSDRARGTSRPGGCPRRARTRPAACSRASASSSCSSGCGMTQRRWFFSGRLAPVRAVDAGQPHGRDGGRVGPLQGGGDLAGWRSPAFATQNSKPVCTTGSKARRRVEQVLQPRAVGGVRGAPAPACRARRSARAAGCRRGRG